MVATLALALTLLAAPQPQTALAATADVPSSAVAAQAVAPEAAAEKEFDVLSKVKDARYWESPFGKVYFPDKGSWMVGPVDMTPTKHVFFLGLSGLITVLLLTWAGRAARRTGAGDRRGRRYNAVEAMVLFLRDQVIMPNVGHGGERYVPFLVTLFFFIVTANLLGLIPWGSTATANIAVTAALAIMSLVVIEAAGMRAQGVHYINTIVYWNRDLALPLRVVLALIMTPVELIGKFTKPFALAVRLFANMTAGGLLLISIISLIFVFGSVFIAVGPVIMAVALTFLKLFVAFLQAYVFTLLTAVFIGLIMHAH